LRVLFKSPVMQKSKNSPLLIAIVLVFTFPLWFGLCAGLFGLIMGLCGAAIGIVAGIIGLIVGVIALPFKLLFGWGDWDYGFELPFFHTNNGFVILFLIVLAIIIAQRKK
jgi:hypothetical protein